MCNRDRRAARDILTPRFPNPTLTSRNIMCQEGGPSQQHAAEHWYTRLHYDPSRTTSSSSASLAFILGTSCNLVSSVCFSSCMAKRFSASSFVLTVVVRCFHTARNHCKLTRRNPLDRRSVGSCGGTSIVMAGETQ